MSILSDAGAICAAKEIKLLAEHELAKEELLSATEILLKIIKKADEIIRAAESGRY